jgi:hypothetical protein
MLAIIRNSGGEYMQDIFGDDPIQHVQLAIRTPRGTWPTEGFMEVPARRGVREQLTRAVEALGIEDATNGWEASSEGRSIDARTTLMENGLAGEVIIRYGPPGHAVHRKG